ncbi:MAG TPA: hypothetical protein VK699_14670 [Terriglobales bacterium]|jgi:hypothetical protein|nr:hypothetical protein [Terriglobales bacterium]
MKYQFVIQFAAESIDDFDRLAAFEESLIEGLDDSSEVDGHDFGVGEFNIFVFTDEPAKTFERVQQVVKSLSLPYPMRVAYCDRPYSDGAKEDFVILWPPDLKEFKVL